MPDVRFVRPRPGVRIYLAPADIVEMITQPDVLSSLNEEELSKISFVAEAELQNRSVETKENAKE
jgi:hypothetical protein